MCIRDRAPPPSACNACVAQLALGRAGREYGCPPSDPQECLRCAGSCRSLGRPDPAAEQRAHDPP
eukprot:11540187-Alexandrium_andersonii.AAC.1